MKERDYIAATNVVRIRLMQTLLREMTWEPDGVPDREARDMAVTLSRWEAKCAKVLTPSERPADVR